MLPLLLSASAAAQTVATRDVPPPAVPPKTIPHGEWNVVAESQELDGSIYRLHGHPAELEDGRMLFRADEIDWNQDTGDVHAAGHVFFWNFDQNMKMWADHLVYNTDAERGKFYDVIGETQTKIVARPGVLTSNQPYHFEGDWAERVGEKYILYHGWATNCKLPNPWWRLKGSKFDIIPDDRAISHNSTYVVRHFPVFYTPFFYHSLASEPRKSGFLMPNLGHSSQRGEMFGIGYFWAINRSTDVTYRVQDFTARGFTHHLDFRAKPRAGTDLDFILYGVQDRGLSTGSGSQPVTYSGISMYGVGRADLGHGWTAHGQLNYITSFRFRQEWTESFNEAIGSEVHSNGFLNKDWSTYTFDVVAARLENFESTEIPVTDPVTKNTNYLTNAVIIRKLPEAQFYSRDHALFSNLPIWYSLESTAGLLFRSAPVFDSSNKLIEQYQTGHFMNRVNLAPHITTAVQIGQWLHIVPSFGIHETYYSEGQALLDGHYNVVGTNYLRSARDFSVDFVFPSLFRIYNRKTVFGDKLKHVIEPRATYRYVTGIGSNFDDFIRFDDTDLLSDTNELELSLTNRIYAKRGGSVQEIFTWEIAQKRYFDPTFGGALISGQRNIFESTAGLTAYAFLVGPRSTSPVASTLRVSPIGGLGFLWQADYDPLYHAIVDSSFSVDYRFRRYFISAGNNEVHSNPLLTPYANQFRFHVGYGDSNRRGWNAAMDLVYDYRQSVIQYSTTQVTYNTDCCGLSFQYRRYNIGIRDEVQYRMAFSIANLGSFGTLRKQDRLF